MTIDPQVDQLVEPDESVLVTLATGSGYTIGTASSATGVILNDDQSTVDVSVDPVSILEDADGVLTYTFTRDNASAETPALTVNFGTTGAATSGTDYVASHSGSVTFASGSATATMTIDPEVDQLVEPDESVLVTLAAGSGYTIGTASSATGVILNDDQSTVDVSVDPVSILEDADGVLTYTFTRDNVSSETPALTVNFGTTGAATSGTDYVASHSGSVTFASGCYRHDDDRSPGRSAC